MSAGQALDSDLGPFGRFGYPSERPQNTAPWDPEMARSMAATNAHIEAQRLRRETEMNTPENSKIAAEAAEAELAEKRRAWGTRVGATPLDGFEGIYDSAEDRELRVYTRTYDLKHKFWGIKPVGMTICDFWDIYDPEVKRHHDANQETPANPETSLAALPPTNSPQSTKSTSKPRRSQKSSNINPTHRIRKSTKPLPKANQNPRKSLAHKIDSGNSGLRGQMGEVKETAHASGRSTRNKGAVTASGPDEKSVKGKSTKKETPSQPLKRLRGRPPVKEKSTDRPSKQKKIPVVKGNARITKPSQKEPRPSAPSTHKMRTRRAGPAEPLQLS